MKNKRYRFTSRLGAFLSVFIPLQMSLADAARANEEEMAQNSLDYFPLDEPAFELREPPVNLSDSPFLDLESLAQDFVLGTKKMEIPGYPDAFNPSITRWRGSLLLSFRIYDRKAGTADKMGLVWLDDDFCQLGPPKILKVLVPDPLSLPKRQDPRLITVGDRLFIVYNNVLKGIVDRELRRMFVTELYYDGESFYSTTPSHLMNFEGVNNKRSEKNWVPFTYEDTLLLGYSISPHRILRPLIGTNTCENYATSQGPIKWKWGTLRGGTPALLDGDHYLAFFHSSDALPTVHSMGKKIPHYFMGAYTFSSRPPFTITAISPEPIVGRNFYHGLLYKTWKPLHVVFPGGFVFDDRYIWIVYGRQDHEVWIVKLDKKGLLRSLVPVVPDSIKDGDSMAVNTPRP